MTEEFFDVTSTLIKSGDRVGYLGYYNEETFSGKVELVNGVLTFTESSNTELIPLGSALNSDICFGLRIFKQA